MRFVVAIAAKAATSELDHALLTDAPFKSGLERAYATLSSGVLTP